MRHANGNADGDSNRHAYADGNADCDSNSYAYANGYANGDRNAQVDAYDPASNPDTQVTSDTAASPIGATRKRLCGNSRENLASSPAAVVFSHFACERFRSAMRPRIAFFESYSSQLRNRQAL